MPLNDYLPVIDNRRFDDLVMEARTRIARYTPEWAAVWTDLNDNDPGITLVQLFAWMTELLTYRLGKVPAQNYLKFLELIGIELMPAAPAQAEITFPAVPTFSDPYVIVPLHTQVTAPGPDGGPPVVFETDRALHALTAFLAAVLVYDGSSFSDVTAANHDAQTGFQPFGAAPGKDAALMLGFQYTTPAQQPLPFPQVELNLAVWAQQAASPEAGNCSLPESQVYPSAQLTWQYWNGAGWYALDFLKDETLSLQRAGHIYLKTPPQGRMQTGTFGSVTQPLYWVRALITGGSYEKQPQVLALRANTASATQAQTVHDEVLGGSNGRPNQTFSLANSPVLDGTLELQVDEGDGFEDWAPIQDFFSAQATDRVYVLDRTTGTIRFGDGTNGSIPVANVDNPTANVVARVYRYGGGKQGNVAAGTLTTLMTSLSGLDANKVTNLFAASNGRDEETLDAAKLRAPLALKSRCRAVTKADFEVLAMEAGNVKRAFAMPLTNPAFPGVVIPGAVTVVVVPDADVPSPMPSSGTIRSVCAYLNLRRLLTTELFVVPPTYQLVHARVEVIAENSADLAEVQQAIATTLRNYFHPLKGGEDGQGWPFGGPIYFSRVYHQILNVNGVDRVEKVVIVLDGQEYPECQDVSLRAGALAYSTDHEVLVTYAFS